MTDGGPRAASRRRWLHGLAASALTGAAAESTGSADASQRLPLLTPLASDGLPVAADDAPWRVLYLDFWASWCAPCRLSFPWMDRMHARHAGAGLRIVAVGLDRDEADARAFIDRMAPRFAIVLDPGARIATRIGVRAMPTSLIVASDRRILLTHRGFRLDDRDPLERQLLAALA